MSADKAIQIKGMLNRNKEKIKARKRFIVACIITVVTSVVAFLAFDYANGTVTTYNMKEDVLADDIKEVEVAKQQIEDEKKVIEETKADLISTSEALAKNNQSIIEENMRLQDTLKKAAAVGITPQNFGDAEKADTAVDYSKLEYIGEFEGTAYTPSPDECSNNLGYTASR